MAQDETYQTKVYMEQGGNRYVAGSGGVFAVESGGSMFVYSGAQIVVESGANFAIAGGDIAGHDLRHILVSEQLMDSQNFSAAVNTLAISNLPKNLGTYTIWASAAAAANDASFWLTSVSAGREVFLGLAGDSTGAFTNPLTTVVVSTSGCIILGSVGQHVSKFTMNASAASDVLVHLVAIADNTWSIVFARGDVNESTNL